MKCPLCNSSTEVLETRVTLRRRACLNKECGHRFKTLECVLDYVPDEPKPQPKPKPKPERAPRPEKQRAIARMNARRELERRRDSFDAWSEDNDYLPEV